MSVELRPLDIGHVARLRELHLQPGVTRRWGTMDPQFPFDEPESQRFAIVADGELVGMIQWGDDSYEDARHAYVDIFLGDEFTGRGIGTEAMQRLTRMLIEQHDYHRITLEAAVDNATAIRAYEKAGFRPVGTLQRSYREDATGNWRDELLMELVVS